MVMLVGITTPSFLATTYIGADAEVCLRRRALIHSRLLAELLSRGRCLFFYAWGCCWILLMV